MVVYEDDNDSDSDVILIDKLSRKQLWYKNNMYSTLKSTKVHYDVFTCTKCDAKIQCYPKPNGKVNAKLMNAL